MKFLRPLLLVGVFGLVSGMLCRSLVVYGWHVLGYGLLLALLMLGAFVVYRVRQYLYVGILVLCFVLGGARVLIVPYTLPEIYAPLLGTHVEMVGVVVANPDVRESTQRVRVRVHVQEVETTVLAVLPRHPILEYGDRVKVAGTFESPSTFETDGGRVFDYPHFLAKDGIFAMLNRATVSKEGVEAGVSTAFFRTLYGVRHTFEQGVARALPEPSSALALGLVVGGKQGLGKTLLEAFTLAGLLPIVVLSGYNVMIVADAVLRGFRFMPKPVATGLAVITLLFFVLAAGAGSSAVRAGTMAAVALFARATGRTYHALRILLLAIVLMLLANPLLLLYDPGFQFSCVATLGLIIGTPILAPRLMWVRSVLLRETLATTLSAQIFVLPLLLYETGNLSLVAVPANMLVLPVVPLAMLCSFIAGLVGMVSASIAPFVGLPAFVTLSYIMGVATTLSSLPFAASSIPEFPFVIVVLLYVVLGGLVWRLQKTTPHPQGVG